MGYYTEGTARVQERRLAGQVAYMWWGTWWFYGYRGWIGEARSLWLGAQGSATCVVYKEMWEMLQVGSWVVSLCHTDEKVLSLKKTGKLPWLGTMSLRQACSCPS